MDMPHGTVIPPLGGLTGRHETPQNTSRRSRNAEDGMSERGCRDQKVFVLETGPICSPLRGFERSVPEGLIVDPDNVFCTWLHLHPPFLNALD